MSKYVAIKAWSRKLPDDVGIPELILALEALGLDVFSVDMDWGEAIQEEGRERDEVMQLIGKKI